jgi:hypothetical protein
VVDQDPAHHLRGQPKKLRPVAPVHAVLLDEPQVGLVHERGGLERVARALGAQLRGREVAQLVVDRGQEAVEVRAVAAAPSDQELGDGGRWGRLHGVLEP